MKTINIPYNPFARDAQNFPVKILPTFSQIDLSEFPNFDKSGSVKGMKKQFYGKGALLIKKGSYIYNVSNNPDIYFNL